MIDDERFVRTYSKNKSYTGKHVATKLWVGSYTAKATFEEFAESAQGINRVGILRADVDNLGQEDYYLHWHLVYANDSDQDFGQVLANGNR
ncbi:MAG: hypothetical protein J6M92_10360 [Oribacterium sp.]|nr:hypothetical protein [Oribacterium sp.]